MAKRRPAYVAVTRGKEQALIFTDNRNDLLKAISRPDDPLSATEISKDTQKTPRLRGRLKKQMSLAGDAAVLRQRHDSIQPGGDRDGM